ncbi:chorismate mutase, partial [Halomonas elongata]
MSDTPKDLEGLRQRIDQLDSDIMRLISERAECARSVAETKTKDDP